MNISDEEIDSFLNHFGIKGQRWGVRKSRSSGGRGKPALTTTEKAIRTQKRIETAVLAGGILAVGALMASSIISGNRSRPMSSINVPRENAKQMFNTFGGIKVKNIRTGFSVSPSGVATPTFRRLVTL